MTQRDLIGALTTASGMALLAGCGGGGSPDAPTPPPPANAAPTLTLSSASANVVENSVEPLLTATAEDADGDVVTLSLAGEDAALFTIGADGVVSFASGPDFETPRDADADNLYRFDVVATDARAGRTREAVEVSVTDLDPLPSFAVVASGLSVPTYTAELDGTGGQLLVLEKGGRLRLLDPETGEVAQQDFLSLDDINSEGEGGVLGFATPADYETDRRIYVHVNNPDGDTEIRRYTLAEGSGTQADPATGEVIIRIPQPRNNHNAGSIGFDANGFLVVPMGDSGGAGDPDGASQDPDSLLGKVLRLDITRDSFPNDAARTYAVPDGNMFPNGGGRPEIFALGLRNPFRSSFDPASGDLLIADVGQDEREEINRLPMDVSGVNFGWNIREGTLEYDGNGTAAGLTLPIAEYGHGNGPTQGNSVTGGVVFDGESTVLDDAYVFADFSSDNIWAIPAGRTQSDTPLTGDGFRRVNDQLLLGSGRPSGIVSFAVGSGNVLYVTTIGGTVYRLEERE